MSLQDFVGYFLDDNTKKDTETKKHTTKKNNKNKRNQFDEKILFMCFTPIRFVCVNIILGTKYLSR